MGRGRIPQFALNPRIYADNLSQIGPNPNLVRVGVKLVSPG